MLFEELGHLKGILGGISQTMIFESRFSLCIVPDPHYKRMFLFGHYGIL